MHLQRKYGPGPPKALARQRGFTMRILLGTKKVLIPETESYLPINALQTLKYEGLIKGISAKFHSVPTVYSHRTTIEHDAPEILSRVISDHADAALLVPL